MKHMLVLEIDGTEGLYDESYIVPSREPVTVKEALLEAIEILYDNEDTYRAVIKTVQGTELARVEI